MRYIGRGIAVIALCSMATSCTRTDTTGPDNDIVAAGQALTPELEILRNGLLDHMEQLGAPTEELVMSMDAITEAALQGEVDAQAITSIVESLTATPPEVEKASAVLTHYAESVIEGEFIQETSDPGAALGVLALCNSCATAQPVPAATASCQFISGNESSTCYDANYYRINVPANSDCVFTTCPSWPCGSGANATYDTYLWLYNSSCSQITYNDDVSCSQTFRSGITWSNPGPATSVVIRVGGYSSSTGNFNLGYSCTPRPEACAFSSRLGISDSANNKPSWLVSNRIYRNGVRSTCANGKACPGTYSSATRAYDRWDMPFTVSAPTCVTVDMLSTTCSSSMVHPVAYTGSYPVGYTFACTRPGGVRYLGDSGSSIYPGGPRQPFSFWLPANTPWSVVVMGANSTQTGCNYTFEVTPCTLVECEDCQACMTGVTPGTVGTDAGTCGTTQTFEVEFDHTDFPYAIIDWSITPPAGGSASPSSGTINVPTGTSPATFTTTLTRANCPASGSFALDMVAEATCPGGDDFEYSGTITLNDDDPPTLGPREDICLWPPNHEMFCQDAVDLREVHDNCGDAGIVGGAETCTSDQPDNSVGDGNTTGDCTMEIDDVTGQQMICARAERSGTIGEGRTYRITGRYRDACGNFTPATTLLEISVPHDMSEHPECISPM